jgi:hypothetical protein
MLGCRSSELTQNQLSKSIKLTPRFKILYSVIHCPLVVCGRFGCVFEDTPRLSIRKSLVKAKIANLFYGAMTFT